jgi:LPS sulfotransferase NodH
LAAWEGFFKAEGILPVRVTYEDVLSAADGVLGRIGDEMGTDFLPAPPARYRKLADALSEEWLHQLRLDQLGMT